MVVVISGEPSSYLVEFKDDDRWIEDEFFITLNEAKEYTYECQDYKHRIIPLFKAKGQAYEYP